MTRLAPYLTALIATAFTLTGCLIQTETEIKPDPKVDPRLAGVWKITKKSPNEIRSDRDEDDIGVYGYIIFAPLVNPDGRVDEATLKGLAFDSFERDSESKFPEMFVSTRKHKGHNLMLIRLADHEKEKADEDKNTLKNWVIDYEFNENDELFLRFWFIDGFDEMQKVHLMEFDQSQEPFSPVTLTGDEKALLDFYADPQIRALLISMGKYQRLAPSNQNSREHAGAGQPATRSESKSQGSDKPQPESEGRSR